MKLTKDKLKQLIKEELEEAYRTRKRGYDWGNLPYHAGAAYDAAVERAAERKKKEQERELNIKFMKAHTDVQDVVDNIARPLMHGDTPKVDPNMMRNTLELAIKNNPVLKDKLAGLDISDIVNKRIASWEYGGEGRSPDKPHMTSILGAYGPGRDFEDPKKVELWNQAKSQILSVVNDIETILAPVPADVNVGPAKIHESKKLRVKIAK